MRVCAWVARLNIQYDILCARVYNVSTVYVPYTYRICEGGFRDCLSWSRLRVSFVWRCASAVVVHVSCTRPVIEEGWRVGSSDYQWRGIRHGFTGGEGGRRNRAERCSQNLIVRSAGKRSGLPWRWDYGLAHLTRGSRGALFIGNNILRLSHFRAAKHFYSVVSRFISFLYILLYYSADLRHRAAGKPRPFLTPKTIVLTSQLAFPLSF